MEEDNDGVPPGVTCEKCGAALFSVIPGETAQQEIIAFARAVVGWRENPDVSDLKHPMSALMRSMRMASIFLALKMDEIN
jgi:hypothetical protein